MTHNLIAKTSKSNKMAPSFWPTRRAELLLVSFAICLPIMLAELGIRVVYLVRESGRSVENVKDGAYERKGDFRGKYERLAAMRYSTFLGYFPVENKQGNGYKTNQYGFRYNEDFPLAKQNNELRIFVTGGSTAWGTGPSQDGFYAPIAENVLRGEFPGFAVRFISAGVGSYVSTHERILIVNKLKDFNPDVIVMFSGWNDTYSGYTGKRVVDDTLDYLGAAEVLAKHNPQYSSMRADARNIPLPPNYKGYTFKTKYLVDRLLFLRNDKNAIEQMILSRMQNPEVIVGDLEDNIRVISDFLRRRGTKFVFYLQPTIYSTRKTLTDFENHILESNKKEYIGFPLYNKQVYDLYRTRLHVLARTEKFVFVDGDDAIASVTQTVFDDHVHFGDRGNRFIANHMANVIADVILKDEASLTQAR